jgi:hypothetical protein
MLNADSAKRKMLVVKLPSSLELNYRAPMNSRLHPSVYFVLVGAVLLVIYMTTMQTIPNGSSHYFMIDVGETQIVLNEWGTLHATGYPVYVITGNILTELFILGGVAPLTAPALVSLFWGLLMLALIFVLVYHLTRQAWIAAGVVLAFGLTRTIWIHHVIAEIYTFGLLLQILLLVLALWRGEVRGRIYWLAFIGGLAVAHHRATAMMIPGLLVAVAPILWQERRKLPQIIGISLILGTLGFLQYAYLYIRAQAGADWVYGDPGTLEGLWHEFMGREAARFIGPPDDVGGLLTNWEIVNAVVIRDLTLPGVVAGVAGLLAAVINPMTRRMGAALALVGLVAYGFHVAAYTDVLSALILLVTLILALGWGLLVHAAMRIRRKPNVVLGGLATAALAIYFVGFNGGFIREQVEDTTGLGTIDLLQAVPEGETVMLAWGPLYFAASIGQIFGDELTHITLVDHNDVSTAPIITPEYTLFNQNLDWWQARFGAPVYVQAVAPRLVRIDTAPDVQADAPEGISVLAAVVICDDPLALDVTWQTDAQPEQNLSVYVHGLNADGALIAQGDQAAPVYGWRPLTTWLPGERVRDVYPLAQTGTEQVESIRYGMYRTLPEGGFENVSEYTVLVDCP